MQKVCRDYNGLTQRFFCAYLHIGWSLKSIIWFSSSLDYMQHTWLILANASSQAVIFCYFVVKPLHTQSPFLTVVFHFLGHHKLFSIYFWILDIYPCSCVYHSFCCWAVFHYMDTSVFSFINWRTFGLFSYEGIYVPSCHKCWFWEFCGNLSLHFS